VSEAPDLPLWAAILTSLLLLGGATFALVGAIGLTRLTSFYERVHAPTLGGTLGAALILVGSMVCFSALRTRFVGHELVLLTFMLLTTPTTFILLVRAALYRDRSESSEDFAPLD
jgi:multicomponent K+:H+ antiporter subunit G